MTIEYKVINTPRPDRFEAGVCTLLNEGWTLHGSPFISQQGGMTQALIRDAKDVPKTVVSKSVPQTMKSKSNVKEVS